MAIEITGGHFDDVRIDGLRAAGVYRWRGPLHEGNGTWFYIMDRRASQKQIDALFTNLGGKEQEATTGFAIYGSTIAHETDLVHADIEFEFDLDKRRGRFSVDNVLEADVAPIRNPVTGKNAISLSGRTGDSSSMKVGWEAQLPGVAGRLNKSTKGDLQC